MKIIRILELILGCILLTPAIYSVFKFIPLILKTKIDMTLWTGDTHGIFANGFGSEPVGIAGFTSALPFYFGLMAIAGAYLIKDSRK
jgi:hypothetical protein